jgi:hypothetical protein
MTNLVLGWQMICGVFFDSIFSLLAHICNVRSNRCPRYLQLGCYFLMSHTSSPHFKNLASNWSDLCSNFNFCLVYIMVFRFLALSVNGWCAESLCAKRVIISEIEYNLTSIFDGLLDLS